MKSDTDMIWQRVRYQRDDRVHAGLAPVLLSSELMRFRTRMRNLNMGLEDGWHDHVNDRKRLPWE